MEMRKNGKLYFVVERAIYTDETTADLPLEKREYFIPEVGPLPVGNIEEYKAMVKKNGGIADGLYLIDRFMGDQFVDF